MAIVTTQADPEGVIATAVGAARAIGIACLVLAAITGCAVSLLFGRATANGLPGGVLLAAVAVYLVPGVAYLVLAGRLARHRKWAAIALVTVGGLTALGSGGLLAVTALGPGEPPNPVSLIVLLFFLALSGVLVVSAARAIRSIDILSAADAGRRGRPLGFAPVMPAGPHPSPPLGTSYPAAPAPIPLAGDDEDRNGELDPPTRQQ